LNDLLSPTSRQGKNFAVFLKQNAEANAIIQQLLSEREQSSTSLGLFSSSAASSSSSDGDEKTADRDVNPSKKV
jgi:hypothetical protein